MYSNVNPTPPWLQIITEDQSKGGLDIAWTTNSINKQNKQKNKIGNDASLALNVICDFNMEQLFWQKRTENYHLATIQSVELKENPQA